MVARPFPVLSCGAGSIIETRVALEKADGGTFAMVPLVAIAEAKLVLTDELIKESLRRQKPRAGENETDDAGATRAEAH